MSTLVENIVEKYGTRDPFIIAEKMGITIVYEELGNITAYYNKAFDKKFIHINSNVEGKVYYSHPAASMLYHAITDPEYTVVYNRNKDRVELTELESKAEKFASELLQHRKHAMQFDSFEEYAEKTDISEENKQHLYEWVVNMTKDVNCPKYKECDIMNRILYMIDKIEGGDT